MKRTFVIAGLALVLVVALAGTALAAGPFPGRALGSGWAAMRTLAPALRSGASAGVMLPWQQGTTPNDDTTCPGSGMMGGTNSCTGGMMGTGTAMHDDLETLLGTTHQDLHDQMVAGKSLVEIAAAKGVSKEQLIQALIDGRRTALDQAVKGGRMTQEQAAAMLQSMQANIETMVTAKGMSGLGSGSGMMGAGGMMNGGMMGGRGMMGGAQSGRQNSTPNTGSCPMHGGQQSQPGGTDGPAAPQGEGQQA